LTKKKKKKGMELGKKLKKRNESKKDKHLGKRRVLKGAKERKKHSRQKNKLRYRKKGEEKGRERDGTRSFTKGGGGGKRGVWMRGGEKRTEYLSMSIHILDGKKRQYKLQKKGNQEYKMKGGVEGFGMIGRGKKPKEGKERVVVWAKKKGKGQLLISTGNKD